MAITTALVGLIVLVTITGWVFDIRLLKSLHPQLTTMKANTALCLGLIAVALWLSRNVDGRQKFLVGMGFAGDCIRRRDHHVVRERFRLERWDRRNDFSRFRASKYAISAGQVRSGTAICILLLSGALLLLDGFRRLSYGLALATILVTVVALTGYRYNLPSLYGAVRYTSMALHTTGGFFILCIGVLAARPDRGLTALLIDSWKQKSTRWWRKRLFWMTRRLRRRYVTSWTVVVVVQDNGVGLPSDFDAQTTNTLGFTSAEVLTQQLGGECGFSEAPGFAFTLRFPREAGH